MHTDGTKRCSFLVLLFAAGDLRRSEIAYAKKNLLITIDNLC